MTERMDYLECKVNYTQTGIYEIVIFFNNRALLLQHSIVSVILR